jgi:hypothetical protein
MRNTISPRFFLLLLSALVLAGCSSTRSVMEWREEAFSGKLDNILVIAAIEERAQQRAVEDAYVKQFGDVAVKAIPGYTLLADETVLSRATVEAAIAGQEIDAVLVTRLLGVEEVEEYQPPSGIEYYHSYHRYYAQARAYSSPGYYIRYKVLTLETNVYDTASQQLIWSMQSESVEPSAPQDVIDEQIALTVKRLAAGGLLPVAP